jgi:three-Cys-motif partner protein
VTVVRRPGRLDSSTSDVLGRDQYPCNGLNKIRGFATDSTGVYSGPAVLPGTVCQSFGPDPDLWRLPQGNMTTRTTRAGRGHGFARLSEWSEYKHTLLKHYLRVWCYKLGAFHRELAFVDTCAGAGKYDDGSSGSPLIAASYNEDRAMVDRGTAMTVYAFETDCDVFPDLVENLSSYTSRTPPRAYASSASFFDNPQPVLDVTRGVPTLFFIDPYGTEEVTWDHLRPVITNGNRPSTELLVRIDPTMLARYAGWVSRQSRTPTPVRGAAAFARLLERLNIDTEQIAFEAVSDGWHPTKYALLSQYLELYTTHFKHVQVVPIRATYGAAPKYMMVHATDSAHGAAHLNDVVSTLEDRLFTTTETRKEAAIGQGSLFGPPQRPPRYTPMELDRETYAIIERLKQTSFIDLRAGLAAYFGPDFRERDHKAAVKRLIEAGRIETVTRHTTLEANTGLRVKRSPSGKPGIDPKADRRAVVRRP